MSSGFGANYKNKGLILTYFITFYWNDSALVLRPKTPTTACFPRPGQSWPNDPPGRAVEYLRSEPNSIVSSAEVLWIVARYAGIG
jgi:hypothetical protein